MLSLERSLKNRLIPTKESNKRTYLELNNEVDVHGTDNNYFYQEFENSQEQEELELNKQEESVNDDIFDSYQEIHDQIENDIDSEVLSEDFDHFESQVQIESVLESIDNTHGVHWKSMENFISFPFTEHLVAVLKRKYNSETLNNNQELLYDGARITLKNFDTKLRSIIAHGSLSENLTRNLKDLLIESLPDDSKYKTYNNQETISDKPVIFEFHCCLCGNTVYEGNNKCLKKCEIITCQLHRYTDSSERYPLATINYRPITVIICELLEHESFLAALQVVNNDIKGEGIYSDINDSQYSKKLREEMHNIHISKMNSGNFNGHEVIEISLLLGFSYDGAQIYHGAITNFWPMFITILSLPPELRTTLGHGTFMIGLFTSVSGSLAEDFLIHKCLVEELLLLCKGITLKINNKIFHIQARLCILGVDSKALEKITYTQASNSYAGCPLCRLGTG